MGKMKVAAALAGVLLAGAVCADVPAPWTPVRARDGRVSVWGREYAFASNALPTAISAVGMDLLAAPMRIVCADADGTNVVWTKGGSWVQSHDDESATVCAWQGSSLLAADVTARVEYDGMAEISLALVPGRKFHAGCTISRAWLEIPLASSCATLYHFSPASWSRLDNVGAVAGPMAFPFRCVFWLGNEKGGLSWFCESDEGFQKADPERTIEVLPQGGVTVLRIRLADSALTLPATWRFGLQATPVKPWPRNRAVDHKVHAPQMGAGITIKAPTVWWTCQRAFPDGRIDEALDGAKAQGATTIVFHEDWIPVQNCPMPRPDFKAIVDKCHARGLKAFVYQGYELSPLDPEWGRHHRDWLAMNAHGRFVSYWYREPGQRDYRVCYKNAFADEWLERVKKAYDELELDGLYFDGTIMPRACANERHGCGWRDGKGGLHETYPFFAVRDMMKRLYSFVKSRGGEVDAHQSGYVCPATLAFADTYWDGEQLAVSTQNIKKNLNLAAFRAEFMGRNHGVPCEFLAYERPGKWSMEDAWALALLHDVMVRPCGIVNIPQVADVWKALDGFGAGEAAWTPYWERPVAGLPEKVEASVYRRGAETLMVVSNLSDEKPATVELALPSGTTRARDARKDVGLAVVNGKVKVDLPPFRMALVRFTR